MFIQFVFEVLSDFSFLPALVPLFATRRHFPVAVGILQLLTTLLYNSCNALSLSRIFLEKNQWHQMSDILTLTLILHIMIHLMQNEEETSNILRYVAFFLAWIFKLRDAWDSKLWEGLLVLGFFLSLLVVLVRFEDKIKRMNFTLVTRGCIAGLVALFFFVISQTRADPSKALIGLAHLGAGAACYQFWACLPAPLVKTKAMHSYV